MPDALCIAGRGGLYHQRRAIGVGEQRCSRPRRVVIQIKRHRPRRTHTTQTVALSAIVLPTVADDGCWVVLIETEADAVIDTGSAEVR